LCHEYQRKEDGAYSSSMHKRNGLALLLTLLASSLCLCLIFLLAGLTRSESAAANHFSAQARLRAAARGAALRALGGLQAAAGPDVACSYRDDTHGTRVVGRSFAWDLDGAAELEGVSWRWSVEDLSLSADLAARPMAVRQASAWAKGRAGRPKLPLALPAEPTARQSLALDVGGPEFYAAHGGESLGPGQAWQVRGLLTDALHGGWRQDLSAEASLGEAVGPEIARQLLGPAWSQLPERGRPICHINEGGRQLSTIPVLTDFRLSLGFFNSRHDGRHRLRFHGSGVLWNPLTTPVLAGPQGRLFLCEVIGAPEVTVTNLETSATIVVELDDCPQEDFGVVRQGPRERGLWFWVEVADPETFGLNGRGLLPGEVYAFLNPSEETQPQGLARILSKTTWRLDRRSPRPGGRRAEPTVFLPTDRIEVAVRFRQKVTIHFRPYAGEPSREMPISTYPSAPVITLRDVSFPDFGFRTSGEDYSREDSAGYTLSERRASLRVRLRPRPLGEFQQMAGAGKFRRTYWDFNRPEDVAEWTVASPLLSALDVVDQDASPLAGPLWDLRVNRHDASSTGVFASWRLRDMPGWPYLSVGSLRHLEAPPAHSWHAWLDRGFFSGGRAGVELSASLHQPFLLPAVSASILNGPSAQHYYVLGPWNVNSRDPAAWESFLRGAAGSWHAEPGGPFDSPAISGPLFFTRPGGAGQPKWGAVSPLDLADEGLALLPRIAGTAAQGGQLVRRIDEPRLRAWARKIVELQPACGWPYASLRSFAGSDLLERSIRESGINGGLADLPSGWPLRLEAADLLEAWAPLLTVRGDTFRIVGTASAPEGSIACEMVVQRVADEHPFAPLGRRFRIISLRFRNP
jgi:hypothetical protein